MVREVASKASDQAGDGNTTATILAHAIVKEGAKGVAAGMNPMDLKRGVDLAVEAIVEDLKKNSKNVTSNEEIAQVGTISANGDANFMSSLRSAVTAYGNGRFAASPGPSPPRRTGFASKNQLPWRHHRIGKGRTNTFLARSADRDYGVDGDGGVLIAKPGDDLNNPTAHLNTYISTGTTSKRKPNSRYSFAFPGPSFAQSEGREQRANVDGRPW
jgi:hypothetical protein